MKYINFFMLAAAMMAAMSCVKENAPENKPEENANLVEMTFTAYSDDSQTKAAFDEETYPAIVWEGTESIAVLGANTDQEFTTTSTGKVAEFTGLADITDDQFYAVYPYDEGIALDGEVLTNVKIPSVQTVTEGSFDPKAFVAVAKSDDKQNFTFKAVGGFLKFQVGDNDVKSVTVMANSYTENEEQKAAPTIAGTAGISWSNDNPAHGLSNWTSDKSSSIKLVEDAEGDQFAAGKNYFITMRANSCPGGITVYVEYDNGEVYSISSTKQLFTTGVQNMIKNLGTFTKSKMTKVDDLYVLYDLGYDITVGGKVYNKSTHTATLLTATEASTSLYTSINNGGLYFLETSGEGSFNLHSNVAAPKDVILIGNSADAKVSVDLNGKNVNHAAGTIALKNIALDVDAHTNYVFANNNATADTEAFILDNCSVNGLLKPLYYVNVADYTCKNVVMVDTDVKLGGSTSIIDLYKTTSLGNETVKFSNCIFYSESNTVSRIVNNSQSFTAVVNFENNTIFNLHAGTNNGLLHMASANSVVFRNNLVNFYSLNATEYVICVGKNEPSYTVENNHFWARASSGIPNDLILYGNVKVEAADAVITSTSYPFASNVVGAGATR